MSSSIEELNNRLYTLLLNITCAFVSDWTVQEKIAQLKEEASKKKKAKKQFFNK